MLRLRALPEASLRGRSRSDEMPFGAVGVVKSWSCGAAAAGQTHMLGVGVGQIRKSMRVV